MTYLAPDFDLDLFVTYSHGDPQGVGNELLKNWSRKMANFLLQDITSTTPDLANLEHFIDERLDTTRQLTDELRSKVNKSALLLLLMSPSYLRSAWCNDELTWFCDEVDRRGRGDGLIFVVRALPTTQTQWPAFLKDERGNTLVGFQFHRRPEDEATRPYGWPEPQPTDREFFEELARLSGAVVKRLKGLRQRIEQRRQAAAFEVHAQKIVPGQVVYLHGHVDDGKPWTETRDALMAAGYLVVPGRPEVPADTPEEAKSARQERVRQLANCDALLILGTAHDARLDSDLLIIAHRDRQAAIEISGRPLPCAVLDRVGKAIPVADQFRLRRIDVNVPDWLNQISLGV
jgi:TIR domain